MAKFGGDSDAGQVNTQPFRNKSSRLNNGATLRNLFIWTIARRSARRSVNAIAGPRRELQGHEVHFTQHNFKKSTSIS